MCPTNHVLKLDFIKLSHTTFSPSSIKARYSFGSECKNASGWPVVSVVGPGLSLRLSKILVCAWHWSWDMVSKVLRSLIGTRNIFF